MAKPPVDDFVPASLGASGEFAIEPLQRTGEAREALAMGMATTASGPVDSAIDLAARLRCSDATALRECYERTVARVFALAAAIVDEEALIEQTVEDAYVALWERRAELDGRRSPLAFVLRLVRERALALGPRAAADPVPTLLDRLDPASPLYPIVARLSLGDQRVLARLFLGGEDAVSVAQGEGRAVQEIRGVAEDIATRLRAAMGR